MGVAIALALLLLAIAVIIAITLGVAWITGYALRMGLMATRGLAHRSFSARRDDQRRQKHSD